MKMMREKFPYAGMTVKIKSYVTEIGGNDFTIEDYVENVTGKKWIFMDGNPAALQYAIRAGSSGLPVDNEVVYGKIGRLGYMVHISELELPLDEQGDTK